jgi:integrase
MASIQRRPDGTWRVRYREASGVERAKHFERKGDAERFRATVQADLIRGTYLDPDAGKVTFAEFAGQWLAGQTVDPSTSQALEVRLRVHLLPTFGGQELRAIRPSNVQAWLSGLQQQLAASYLRVLLANLSGILRAAVDDGLIARNPCQAKSVRAPMVPRLRVRPWTSEQVQSVVAGHPDRYRVVPIVAAGCGLRQGEVFGLRVSDVDFLRRTLHVRQQVKLLADNRPMLTPPKGGKTREVPLPDTVATEVAEHMRKYPPQPDDLVFTSRERRPLNRNYINTQVWKKALRTAGVDPSRTNGMHALRHYYASALLEAGVSIRAVSEYLGHADPGFTLRTYAHLMPTSDERARQAMDLALGVQSQDHADLVRTDQGSER